MYSSPRTRSNLRVLGGSSHPELTRAVAKKVGVRVGETHLEKFANRETRVELKENVRGQDIYILQTGGGSSPNDSLMELMFLINACRLSAAGEITVITPYYPYSKGDQKAGHRVPIASKLVADLLWKAGATYIMLLDPHTPQMEGFFNGPVDALLMEPLFCDWIKRNIPNWEHCVVVSPDEGAVKKSVSVANDLNLDFALIHNRLKPREEIRTKRFPNQIAYHSGSIPPMIRPPRSSMNSSESEENPTTDDDPQSDGTTKERYRKPSSCRSEPAVGCLSGSVDGRTVIMIDDMVDTGKTLRFALEVLEREGASCVYFFATHGLFSAGCIDSINSYDQDFLKCTVVTNSIPQDVNVNLVNNLHTIDVSGLIAEFIRRHHYRESVSVLSQFMPVRDEYHLELPERLNNLRVADFVLGSNPDLGAAGAEPVGLESIEEDVQDEAVDRQIGKLRKGFRLSSVCWD
eukprot:snap_masked-scaffold10_size831480-processed-gene-3.4 protein:Tk01814 transcript:snap_masked-scaffold10_size831480-processed-gene-3.4-mRNA-1 annotation:"hypothetical protein A1Q1_04580"